MEQYRNDDLSILVSILCKMDAQFGAIEVGELWTTSPMAGHAMRVASPNRWARADSDIDRAAVEGESIWERSDKPSNVNVNAE
jgi:hypothetical protein